VCTANGGRSVLSERLFERAAAGRHHARSAGSEPGTGAHPRVLEAQLEGGIDASDHVPQRLTQELIDWADVVVATCDDACPYVPEKRYLSWHLPDPRHEPIERVRELRAEIAGLASRLAGELDAADASPGSRRGDSNPGPLHYERRPGGGRGSIGGSTRS
jgi:arsenate reductase